MTRLVHGFPGYTIDHDGGSAADLNTDVMRFMAILALCLVAIFALVQAVPAEKPPDLAERDAETVPAPAAPTLPEPQAEPRMRQVETPTAPMPEAKVPAPIPVPREPEPQPSQVTADTEQGFTLRFESDMALRSLVARNEVGFYAFLDNRARRLHMGGGRPQFRETQGPAVYHEMEAATVPADVVAALGHKVKQGRDVRWGVTLPPHLARAIDLRVAGGGSGNLVIAANGGLREE